MVYTRSVKDQPNGLTPIQERILDVFKAAAAVGAAAPTYRELGARFGWTSTGTARDHLRVLERKGVLRREPGVRNYRLAAAPDPVTVVPVVRRFLRDADVLAGANRDGEACVPSSWLRANGRHFAMRVPDDTMREDALLRGDLLVVRAGKTVRKGALVVEGRGNELLVIRAPEPAEAQRDDFSGVELSDVDDNPRVVGVAVGVMRRLGGAHV